MLSESFILLDSSFVKSLLDLEFLSNRPKQLVPLSESSKVKEKIFLLCYYMKDSFYTFCDSEQSKTIAFCIYLSKLYFDWFN